MNFDPDLTVFDDAAYAGILAASLVEKGIPVQIALPLVQASVPDRKVPAHLREVLDVVAPGFCDAFESDMNDPRSWDAARELHAELVASGELQSGSDTDPAH